MQQAKKLGEIAVMHSKNSKFQKLLWLAHLLLGAIGCHGDITAGLIRLTLNL